tara:strand:+ start:1805 stop:2449 length:645 start_codon:yes stop_codon:yes gene_type:complete
MNQEAEIINQDTRIERIKNFFINNKKSLISILIIIILIIFGYFFYKDYKNKQKTKLAEKYNYITTAINENNKSQIVNELKDIILAKDSTYSPLALYFIIDNSLIRSKNEVNDFFDTVINETKLEKEIKNLIIYKKGLYNAEFESEDNLLNILKPLLNSESIWRAHALYLMAEYFYSKGEKKKSKEFFQKILEIKNVNQNIFIDAQKRIQRDFSE